MSPQRLGQILKRFRQQQGLTQLELCKKARVSQGYLAKLERGDKTSPSLATLQRLAKALKVKVADLLT